MLKKSEVPVPPLLEEEIVPVPELKGDVLVRAMMLKDRIELAVTTGYARMAPVLAACILVDGGIDEVSGKKLGFVPLYTIDEWERWGAKNHVAALTLWNKASELSDLEGHDAVKNSSAQKSESPAV